MTQTDLIKEKIELYSEVKQEYIRKFEKDPRIDEITTIFDRVDHWLLSQQIQKERQGVHPDKEKDKDKEGHCNSCGRKLTEGEIGWIQDHDAEEICYHCKKK